MKDLELRLTDLLARKADEVDVRPVDGFAETPDTTAVASTDLEPTSATSAPKRSRGRVAAAILAAAAAVVAIALVATRDEDATPADQPSPTVTVPPTVPPRALILAPEHLAPGTYFVDLSDVSATRPRILVTVGAGWSKGGSGPTISNGNGEGFLTFNRPDAVFSDACHPLSEGLYPGPVTTLDGLVAALTEQQGWAAVTDPTDISIDGYVGKAFQRTAPADMSACDTTNSNTQWSDQDPRTPNPYFASWRQGALGVAVYEPGTIETLWVLDIDGTVVVINTRPILVASAAVRDELAAVLDSIRIDRGSDAAGIPGVDTIGTEVISPLETVGGSLTSGADVELFRVTTDEPAYWRLTTLPAFDGHRWRIPESDLSTIDDTADSPPDGRTNRQQLQVLELRGHLLPAAADPTQVAPATDIRFSPDTGTILTTTELASGDQYTIVSVAPDLTPTGLRAATTDNPPDEIFLGLPDDVPDNVYDTAAEVTAAATTDYDRMIALQNWFRDNFEYSTEVQAGHGTNAIENFLQIRRGYCEQFVATFAVMARTLGIPSRVAVGYTPGQLRSDGWYSVLGRNSHAWPEIWFDGIGWVGFEPTPGRGIPGAEVYTGVPAAQDTTVPDLGTPEPGAATPPPIPTTVFSPPTAQTPAP